MNLNMRISIKLTLKEKRIFFKDTLETIIENPVIKKCDRSYDICAIKYGPKQAIFENTLVLQEFSRDEGRNYNYMGISSI
jgi:hypothetical protein